MHAAPRLELAYRVRFDEAGADGQLRASGFLRYAQDLAWQHSESAGFGRDWYSGRGLTWLIRAVELDVLAEMRYGSQLAVSTEVVGFRRVWARRVNEFRLAGGKRPAAAAITDWVLLDARGRPVSVPADILAVFATPSGTFTPLRLELSETPTDAGVQDFAPRVGEVDPLGHVNNAAYLDYLDGHLASIGERALTRRRPRRYRSEFVAAAEPGMALHGALWRDELAWCYRLDDAGGRELFRARLETDPASWVGG
jgi:medium-chain acyl-[acyl-carrier-protein] hydrolase